MIAVLVDALHLAEVGCVLLGAVPLAAAALGRGRRWLTGGALVAILALAADAAWVRDTAAADGVRDLPLADWAGLVALHHAHAARIGWVAGLVGALVVAAEDRATAARWVVGVAGGILAVSAIAAPQLGWVALAAVAVAGSGRGLAGVLLAVAAIAGAEANLYAAAALVDPADAWWLDPSAGARIAAWVAAALLGGWGIARIGPTRGLVPVAAVIGLVALDVGWARQGMAFGPARELATVGEGLAVQIPTQVARLPGGCLVTREGTGWTAKTIGSPLGVLEKRGLPQCPSEGPVSPGTFGQAGVPVLAVAADAPVTDLLGWHGTLIGNVVVLTRIGDGRALPAWRISGVHLPVWQSPGGSPLPGAFLVRAPGTVDQQLAGLPDPVRLDVLVHPSAVATVGDLLSLCRAAADRHPVGLRCILVAGDADEWAHRLVTPAAPPPEANWETVETDDDSDW